MKSAILANEKYFNYHQKRLEKNLERLENQDFLKHAPKEKVEAVKKEVSSDIETLKMLERITRQLKEGAKWV